MSQTAVQMSGNALNLSAVATDEGITLPAWADVLCQAGIARFNEVGFPSNRDEEWRYTNFSPIAKTAFVVPGRDRQGAAVDLVEKFSFHADAAIELVFVNGRYVHQLSRPGKPSRPV